MNKFFNGASGMALASGLAVLIASTGDADAESRHRPRAAHSRVDRQPDNRQDAPRAQRQREDQGGRILHIRDGGGRAGLAGRADESRRAFMRAATQTGPLMVYHVRSGRLDLAGNVFHGGSGTREGFNNPDLDHRPFLGPAPAGTYPVRERAEPFCGSRAIRLLGTDRPGILVHIATCKPKGRQAPESFGCIAINASEYPGFIIAYDRHQPTHIKVVPN